MSLYLQIMTVLFWFLMGYFCSYTARQKGRDPLTWFFIGLLCGIFGVLAIILLPAVKPEEEPQSVAPPQKSTVLWYYLDGDHNQMGPVSYEQLSDAWKARQIDKMTYVWCEGMEKWERIQSVAELKFAPV